MKKSFEIIKFIPYFSVENLQNVLKTYNEFFSEVSGYKYKNIAQLFT